ncbi:metallophosphoesterase [Alkalicoccus halolimnae]|uniref:Metallophosphoesterase n=1 Tax=Alkalicoccus halolimnae TaxID=1667239 RepID=A0AAJ8N386_9BACI|nr:metallophosphoesterase [Alkalicoccus halolimnae]
MRVLIYMVTGLSALVCYMFFRARITEFLVHDISFFENNLSKRLLFISDLHKRKVSKKDIKRVGNVDLILIGGDITEKAADNGTLLDNLKTLTAKAPVYFVWGNNDYGKRKKLQEYLVLYNVNQLNNRNVTFEEEGWSLAGVEDLNFHFHNMNEALNGAVNPTLLLCHDPEIIKESNRYTNIKLILSGHTHGGQIRIGKFSPAPKGSLKKYQDITHLTSNGYGTTRLPLRLGAPPQIHVINLVNVSKQR